MGISEFQEIEDLFSKNGVSQIYVKELSKKQDNDKNQIYLGKYIRGFPGRIKERSSSNSTSKRKSDFGKNKVELFLNFSWLDKNGKKYPAPNARIINYFQYPEIRLSGFLNGCSSAPDSLRRVSQHKYGKRFLCLGVNENNEILGLVINQLEDPLGSKFPDLPTSSLSSIIKTHSIGYVGQNPRDLLINELKEINRNGWHKSRRLSPDHTQPIPFKGNQGGGYTLEALMGIVSNSNKTPDKYGYEIKSFRTKKVTLMTPTADLGYEGNNNFRDFMGKYGKPGTAGDGRVVFTGQHKSWKIQQSTGCILRVNGYDDSKDKLDENTDNINVELFNNNFAEVAAGWSFNKLFENWNKKHQLACYVPYEKRRYEGEEHDYEYNYSNKILICEGTNIQRLIQAIHVGNVFYDPAHTIYSDGNPKARPQWRAALTHNYRYIENLYNSIEEISII